MDIEKITSRRSAGFIAYRRGQSSPRVFMYACVVGSAISGLAALSIEGCGSKSAIDVLPVVAEATIYLGMSLDEMRTAYPIARQNEIVATTWEVPARDNHSPAINFELKNGKVVEIFAFYLDASLDDYQNMIENFNNHYGTPGEVYFDDRDSTLQGRKWILKRAECKVMYYQRQTGVSQTKYLAVNLYCSH